MQSQTARCFIPAGSILQRILLPTLSGIGGYVAVVAGIVRHVKTDRAGRRDRVQWPSQRCHRWLYRALSLLGPRTVHLRPRNRTCHSEVSRRLSTKRSERPVLRARIDNPLSSRLPFRAQTRRKAVRNGAEECRPAANCIVCKRTHRAKQSALIKRHKRASAVRDETFCVSSGVSSFREQLRILMRDDASCPERFHSLR